MGSRKKHQELAADLESREGFEFFAHRPCPATQGSTFLTHRPRPATQGSIFSARVAEGFDVFLPVYNAAPPVAAFKFEVGPIWPHFGVLIGEAAQSPGSVVLAAP